MEESSTFYAIIYTKENFTGNIFKTRCLYWSADYMWSVGAQRDGLGRQSAGFDGCSMVGEQSRGTYWG